MNKKKTFFYVQIKISFFAKSKSYIFLLKAIFLLLKVYFFYKNKCFGFIMFLPVWLNHTWCRNTSWCCGCGGWAWPSSPSSASSIGSPGWWSQTYPGNQSINKDLKKKKIMYLQSEAIQKYWFVHSLAVFHKLTIYFRNGGILSYALFKGGQKGYFHFLKPVFSFDQS